MNKKINYLFFIPFLGTVIIFGWLSARAHQGKIGRKRCLAYFVSVAILLAVTLLPLYLAADLASDISLGYLRTYGIYVGLVAIGYLVNFLSFFLLNKSYESICAADGGESLSALVMEISHVSTRRMVIVAVFLSAVLITATILAVLTLL